MAKAPGIPDRLRAHPDIVTRRSAPLVWTGVAIAAALLLGWVLLLVNSAAIGAEFTELQDSAVTINQRIGSNFGVLIGAVALPILALMAFGSFFFFSRRYARRATGTPVRRTYRAVFASPVGAGAVFHEQLSTRDPHVIGTMKEGTDRGNLVIEGWSADEDRVAYVGVFEFSHRGPGWDFVEFAGDDFDAYQQIFRAGRA